MTKEEQNQIIKDAWVRNLRKENDLPANIGELYKTWVVNKIAQASSQLQQPAQDAQGAQGAQGGQEAAAQGQGGGGQ